MSLRLVPLTRSEARRFVGLHHRHNLPPVGDVIRVGVEHDGQLVGVGMAGRPVGRHLDDGVTLEITRCTSDGTPNACSMLYGALTRAGAALGYHRFITYTLASEPGSSLRASGWLRDIDVPATPGWDRPGRPRVETDLFGERHTPHSEAKVRWLKECVA